MSSIKQNLNRADQKLSCEDINNIYNPAILSAHQILFAPKRLRSHYNAHKFAWSSQAQISKPILFGEGQTAIFFKALAVSGFLTSLFFLGLFA